MGFRENDTVVAVCDVACPITGRSVSRGVQGVVLKQSGWHPVSFRVRFTPADDGPVILDGVTDRQITRIGKALGDPFEGQPDRPGRPGTATDPWWSARDPLADSEV